MLQASARDQHVGVDQRPDHSLVGVALLTLVIDDALAGKAWRCLGEGAVLVDGIGNGGIDAALFQLVPIRDPNLEVVPSMPRRSVNKAGAVLLGDVLAGKKGNHKVIASPTERVRACLD